MLMLLALLPAARALRAPASARAHPTLRRASSVDLSFEAAAAPASTTVYAGLKDAVAQQAPAGVDAALWAALVDSVKPGDDGAAAASARDGELHRVVAAVLPDHCSRHNSPLRPHALASLVGANAGTEDAAVACRLRGGAAPARRRRAFPLYDAKKGKDDGAPRTVRVAFEDAGGAPVADERTLRAAAVAADAVRLAQRIVAPERDDDDAPLAVEPPALVVVSAKFPANAGGPSAALVGKGVVFDTGGLSLKISGGMVGMKSDCGGAAAVLGGLEAACALGGGAYEEIHCLLCVAENAIGPDAMRCDDIVTFFSGLTCEINNTDAEGRLCLADGVARASTPGGLGSRDVDVLIDMATLTGAQMVSTGQRHAAVFSDDEALEARAVAAGKRSGDLCHPLPFAPEICRAEFKSKVADMKNSVKDRMNAQASCAANFIYENVHADFQGSWLHVDLAGPSTAAERGTGFGVALALALLDVDGFEAYGGPRCVVARRAGCARQTGGGAAEVVVEGSRRAQADDESLVAIDRVA
ncbi:manganese ion binding protein [Aureococcus anophagefferens]|nr:manganese ion binding protein [Aureococcus anophagefferens]